MVAAAHMDRRATDGPTHRAAAIAALLLAALSATSARPAAAQSPEGALLMESGRIAAVVGRRLGQTWCRAKFNDNGRPLVTCRDALGTEQPCEQTPGFTGLVLRIRDGLGFDQTYRWPASQCDTRALQDIFCHGHCEPGGTGTCKATIRDRGSVLGPGWWAFKILPRYLHETPAGPYAGPFSCEIELENGRRWLGTMPASECRATGTRLHCQHRASDPFDQPAGARTAATTR
jgi:hypothetical protein